MQADQILDHVQVDEVAARRQLRAVREAGIEAPTGEPYFEAAEWLAQAELEDIWRPSVIKVARVLMRSFDEAGTASVKVGDLARRARLRRSATEKALRELDQAGWLARDQQLGGRGRGVVYTALWRVFTDRQAALKPRTKTRTKPRTETPAKPRTKPRTPRAGARKVSKRSEPQREALTSLDVMGSEVQEQTHGASSESSAVENGGSQILGRPSKNHPVTEPDEPQHPSGLDTASSAESARPDKAHPDIASEIDDRHRWVSKTSDPERWQRLHEEAQAEALRKIAEHRRVFGADDGPTVSATDEIPW